MTLLAGCLSILALFHLLRLLGRTEYVLLTSVRIREATISHQLVPRFDSIVRQGDVITFIGGDGYYHSSRRRTKFHEAIQRWSAKGCTIRYILVSGSVQANLPLISLLEDVENLLIYFASPHGTEQRALASWNLIERFKTFHPSLVLDRSGSLKAAWIEGYHPDSSHIAYDIDYFCGIIPESVVRDANIYLADFEELIKSCKCVDANNYQTFCLSAAGTL